MFRNRENRNGRTADFGRQLRDWRGKTPPDRKQKMIRSIEETRTLWCTSEQTSRSNRKPNKKCIEAFKIERRCLLQKKDVQEMHLIETKQCESAGPASHQRCKTKEGLKSKDPKRWKSKQRKPKIKGKSQKGKLAIVELGKSVCSTAVVRRVSSVEELPATVAPVPGIGVPRSLPELVVKGSALQ